MDIYVVQQGDTIYSIANNYNVSAEKLLQDNELVNPDDLVQGQTIVIVYPELTYTVQQGDTLGSIAAAYNVSLMQILRNNPYLSNRDYIYPGDVIVISYPTDGSIITNGFAYPYLNERVFKKTLPYLTYLTVFNYRSTNEGNIIAYFDDSKIIQTAKDYGVIPLMMTTTLTIQGEPNVEAGYDILLSEENQENHINNMLDIIKSKGYYGVNMTLNYMNESNQKLYENFIMKAAERIKNEGYIIFATINLSIKTINHGSTLAKIDYTGIGKAVDNLLFMHFIWGSNLGPPAPVSSISELRGYLDYLVTMVPSEKINVALPSVGYDWELPYVPGKSSANSLTLNSAIALAQDVDAEIQFDELSQTPFFIYNQYRFGAPNQHIVWFVDARSIDSLLKLRLDYKLEGTGIWNIMIYFPQVWLLINSQYKITKLLPENI